MWVLETGMEPTIGRTLLGEMFIHLIQKLIQLMLSVDRPACGVNYVMSIQLIKNFGFVQVHSLKGYGM